jgi:hypothetical protein
MRAIMIAVVLAAGAVPGSSAFAQAPGDHVHHTFCLRTGSGQECAYDSMAQCNAAKRGSADPCMPNSPTQNH